MFLEQSIRGLMARHVLDYVFNLPSHLHEPPYKQHQLQSEHMAVIIVVQSVCEFLVPVYHLAVGTPLEIGTNAVNGVHCSRKSSADHEYTLAEVYTYASEEPPRLDGTHQFSVVIFPTVALQVMFAGEHSIALRADKFRCGTFVPLCTLYT